MTKQQEDALAAELLEIELRLGVPSGEPEKVSGWIDASKQLPENNTDVLVRYHAHFDDEEITEFDFCTAFFGGGSFDAKDQLFYEKREVTVTHLMPLPELPVNKESDCE